MAKKAIEDLGMASLLREKEHWDNPPIPGSATITISREDDDADDDKEQEMMVDQDIVHDAESKDLYVCYMSKQKTSVIVTGLKHKFKITH